MCITHVLRFFVPAHPSRRTYPVDHQALDEGVDGLSRRPWAPLVADAAAGVLDWIATFPFDVLKTRLQVSTSADVGPGTSWRTACKMYDESGGRVFWHGLVPTLMHAIPVNMAVFGMFEGVVPVQCSWRRCAAEQPAEPP